MEMTKRERRAARAFDDSRPPLEKLYLTGIRWSMMCVLSFLGRGVGVLAVLCWFGNLGHPTLKMLLCSFSVYIGNADSKIFISVVFPFLAVAYVHLIQCLRITSSKAIPQERNRKCPLL